MQEDSKNLKPQNFAWVITGGFILSALLLFVFGFLAESYLGTYMQTLDNAVGRWFIQRRMSYWTMIALVFTNIGGAWFEIILAVTTVIYLIKIRRHIWEAGLVIINLAGGYGLNEVLKAVFHRTRPDFIWLTQAKGYSFPSGHAMVAAGFYGFLGYLVWLNLKERTKGRTTLLVSVTLAVIISIGVSRIYLGVHYFSDVAAGFSAGFLWMLSCILGLSIIRYYKARRKAAGSL